MKAIIWKESVYKNNFICQCGKTLYENGQPTDNVGLDADTSQRQDILYCINCHQPVAFVKEYNGDLSPGTKGGKWKGEV